MTKNRIYTILTAEGVDLPPMTKLSKADLEAKYAELHPEYVAQKPDVLQMQDDEFAQEEPEAEPEKIPSLHFPCAGWCEQLGRSYYVGWYQPTSWAEYNALKQFAEG